MKANDYMRLAKISLNSRKKNTRSTVRGIAFGLILIIPVLYMAFGIYMELTSQVNSIPEALSVQIVAGDERNGFEPLISQYQSNNVASTRNLDEVLVAAEGEKFYFEQLMTKQPYKNIATGSSYSAAEAFSFGIGGALSDYYYNSGSGEASGKYKFAAILDTEKSTVIKNGLLCSEKLDKRYDGMYVKNMDKGFTGGGKGQVIVSQLFLSKLGMTAADAYGKKITLEYTDSVSVPADQSLRNSVYIDGDGDPSNNENLSATELAGNARDVKLFDGYEVVGVIKSEITQTALSQDGNSFSSESYLMEFMQNAMFFTSASRDIGGGKALEPLITKSEFSDGQGGTLFIATYTDGYDGLSDEYIGMGANDFTSLQRFTLYSGTSSSSVDYVTPTATLLVDAADYAQLDRIVGQVASAMTGIYPTKTREAIINEHTTSMYYTFNPIYFMFSFIILITGIFGGIVFFSSMVNLFNSIAHSVDTRKHYLGVMRAIGAPGGMIAKLYMAESLTIFRRAAIWIAIFATAACVVLWISVNAIFEYINDNLASMFSVKLSISLAYAPLVIVASLSVLVLIGGLFSYFLSRNIANKPITSILTD